MPYGRRQHAYVLIEKPTGELVELFVDVEDVSLHEHTNPKYPTTVSLRGIVLELTERPLAGGLPAITPENGEQNVYEGN